MPEPVKCAAVITHGRRETVGQAIERLRAVAADLGVEPVMPADELEKHDIDLREAEPSEADIVIVLGGDGTMFRALRRLLGTTVPALGVNFGQRRVPHRPFRRMSWSPACARVFAGEYEARRAADAGGTGPVRDRRDAVNDIVATSSTLGRMIGLAWTVGGESLGSLRCDGLIAATPIRIDGVQPLERRPGAGLGSRRDGGDVRRAALARGAAARDPSGAQTSW